MLMATKAEKIHVLIHTAAALTEAIGWAADLYFSEHSQAILPKVR
jgi:hypothetical protein